MISPEAEAILKSLPPKPVNYPQTLAEIQAERRAWESGYPAVPPALLRTFPNGLTGCFWAGPVRDSVILYLHGGGFIAGSVRTHFALCEMISLVTGLGLLSLEYPLAPECCYPQTVDQIEEVLAVLQREYAKVVVAGDSAGACLALQLLLKLKQRRKSVPCGALLLSPWLDLDLSKYDDLPDDSFDPLVSVADLKSCADHYCKSADRQEALISPAYAQDAVLPPILILVGSREVLLKDALQFFENNRQSTTIWLEVFEGLWHVWPAWTTLPETQQAMAKIAEFTREVLSRGEVA